MPTVRLGAAKTNAPKTERAALIVRLRANGHTLADISRRFGISATRVREILLREQRREERAGGAA